MAHDAIPPATSSASGAWLPVVATAAGIGTFSAMDAAIKGAALAVGVFTPLLLRNMMGTAICTPLWLAAGRPMPSAKGLTVHMQRGVVCAVMASLFFYGLVRLPLAEGIAISFIAPILALYIAALMLGERIRRNAIHGALLGLAGVATIAAGRFETGGITADAAAGIAAILCSALLYAFNLVLQRKQALLAGPVEIALFQNLFFAVALAPAAPWLLRPVTVDIAGIVLIGAIFSTLALLLLGWGYARAEAQVLVPIEYTGFLWAALFGWLFFAEPVTAATLAGAVLVIAGCWIATRTARGAAPR